MPTTSSVSAIEKSVCFVTVVFTDEDGDSVIPNSITWTLSDSSSRIINSRDSVVIATPAASITVILSGDDLLINSPDLRRYFTIEGVYDSTLQNDLPFKDELIFNIANLVGVS